MAPRIRDLAGGRFGHFALGVLLGGLPVFAVWLVEPLPSDQYQAFRQVPSTPLSYLVPALIALLAAVRLGGSGLAGVVLGGAAGFLLAAAIAGPVYHPHPWDELDGVWHFWFRAAGFRTLYIATGVGLAAWFGAAAVRFVRRRRAPH